MIELNKKTQQEFKLSDIENVLESLDIPTVKNLGNGLYRLPDGTITNERGLEQFAKLVSEEIKKK
jgi:hypothetical protein